MFSMTTNTILLYIIMVSAAGLVGTCIILGIDSYRAEKLRDHIWEYNRKETEQTYQRNIQRGKDILTEADNICSKSDKNKILVEVSKKRLEQDYHLIVEDKACKCHPQMLQEMYSILDNLTMQCG